MRVDNGFAHHIALLIASFAWCNPTLAAGDVPCAALPSALQLARDKLEIAKTQLGAARENFGPGRVDALRDTLAAISETELIETHCPNLRLQPAPGTDYVKMRVGKHPHMSYAAAALRDARKALRDTGADVHGAAALKSVERAIEEVDKAFLYRGP